MKAREVGAFEAKTKLSELLEKVDRGQVFIITKRGRPVAELRPVSGSDTLSFGCDKGRIRISDDFDSPVPDLQEYTE